MSGTLSSDAGSSRPDPQRNTVVENCTLSSLEGGGSSTRERINISPSTYKLLTAADIYRQSTSDDDSGCALEEYAWVPSGLRPDMVQRYFSRLPEDKVPYLKSSGEKWRIRQLLLQLPPQDSETRYCRDLSCREEKELKAFVQMRKKEALGRGVVQVIHRLKNTVCSECNETLNVGDLAVFAERVGEHAAWHPYCFICHSCHELLIDLIYFYKDGYVYCGRHHAELFKPRCAACDEIIFADECIEAEGRFWHLRHFACFECDKCLGGTRYVMKDHHPYCLECFETTLALPCTTCSQPIAIEDLRMTCGDRQWHAKQECFTCGVCSKPLLGKSFVSRAEGVFCNDKCYLSYSDCAKTGVKGCNPVSNGGVRDITITCLK
ncbi:unnamed protein product [Soboliphyme baturini]|uniref:Prickle-like protein 1 n=1 Tax=Soboliphyme baturini TaxID=241478 RepID=A0A183IF95_9BILA|nr:unnamed protein product [Soboliphyme baturini]